MLIDASSSLSERAAQRSRDFGLDRSAAPLITGIVLLVLVAGALVWLVYSSGRQSQLVFHSFEVQRLASRLFRSVQSAETGQRGFLLTGDERYLGPYRGGTADFETYADGLVTLLQSDPVERDEAAGIASKGRQKIAELKKTVDLALAGKRDEAISVVESDEGRQLMEDIRRGINLIQERSSRYTADENARGQLVNKLLLGLTLVALAAIVAVGMAVLRANARAIRAVEANRQRIAAQNEVLEAAVAERTSELTESNEEIQRFAYIVSHDLRAPLVNVMGFTSELEALKGELVEAGAKPATDAGRVRTEKEFDESIGFIKVSIEKMEGLIAAILRLSREGHRTFRPERVDTTSMMQALADAQRHQLDTAGAVATISKDLPVLVADRLALEQIFANLIDNAIKYLDPSRPGRIEVTAETIGDRARISVRDNGRGISAHDHRRVFELFRRSGEQNRRGEGIGLAHVQTLVRALGGRITLTSELGKGSTFTVVLPLAPKGQAATPAVS